MQFTIQLTEEQLAQISVNDSPIAYGTKIESPADSAKYLKHIGTTKERALCYSHARRRQSSNK